jgi:hypothetical protein
MPPTRVGIGGNHVQSSLVLVFLLLGHSIRLAVAQKRKELFPRLEAERTSTIDFLYPSRELLTVLLPVHSDAH